jgi:type I restriction enzyme S subunit
MSLPRYPNYKDSGAEWLGEVPEHWEAVPFKRLVDIQNGSDHKHIEQDEGYPVIGSGGQFAYASEFMYDGESVLLGRKGTIDKPLYVLGKFWTVDTMYWTKIAPDACGRYAYFLALNIPFDYYSTNTALPSMTKGALHAHMVSRPPLPEQTQISAFLDRETAKIDELVAEQRRLMELLKEKRQAVISHAVTRGLNPHAPLKPSGIEWLGDVPEHWEVGALGYLATVSSGSTPDRGNPAFWGGDIPWIKTGEIDYLPICRAEEFITTAGLHGSSAKMSEPGTMLMAMYGQGVTRGRVAILEVAAAYNQACAAISLGNRIDNKFAQNFFIAAYHFIRDTGNETSQMNLSTGIIQKFQLTIPPIDEQIEINSFLDKEVAVIDTLTTEAQRAIALLQERRTALISAAVTGQIDVRGAVAA